jgi:hypothetical protein
MTAFRGAHPNGARAVRFRNDSGETIPAYAAIHIIGTETVNRQVLFLADQWDGDGMPIIYFNSHADIEDGDYGQAFQPNTAQWVLYDTEDAIVFQGEWGPVADSWSLGIDGTGFIVMGGETDGRVLAIEKPASTSGDPWIIFQPRDVCTGVGFACNCSVSVIRAASCNSGLTVGDEVNVWDFNRNAFNLPEELLFNSYGLAHKFTNDFFQFDDLEGSGSGSGVDDCVWVVTQMFCVVEDQGSGSAS